MTREQARAEADKRWPGISIIREDSGWNAALPKYRVGFWDAGWIRIVGYGRSWEAAFADADSGCLLAAEVGC